MMYLYPCVYCSRDVCLESNSFETKGHLSAISGHIRIIELENDLHKLPLIIPPSLNEEYRRTHARYLVPDDVKMPDFFSHFLTIKMATNRLTLIQS